MPDHRLTDGPRAAEAHRARLIFQHDAAVRRFDRELTTEAMSERTDAARALLADLSVRP